MNLNVLNLAITTLATGVLFSCVAKREFDQTGSKEQTGYTESQMAQSGPLGSDSINKVFGRSYCQILYAKEPDMAEAMKHIFPYAGPATLVQEIQGFVNWVSKQSGKNVSQRTNIEDCLFAIDNPSTQKKLELATLTSPHVLAAFYPYLEELTVTKGFIIDLTAFNDLPQFKKLTIQKNTWKEGYFKELDCSLLKAECNTNAGWRKSFNRFPTTEGWCERFVQMKDSKNYGYSTLLVGEYESAKAIWALGKKINPKQSTCKSLKETFANMTNVAIEGGSELSWFLTLTPKLKSLTVNNGNVMDFMVLRGLKDIEEIRVLNNFKNHDNRTNCTFLTRWKDNLGNERIKNCEFTRR